MAKAAVVGIFLILAGAAFFLRQTSFGEIPTRWTMLNVNSTSLQADAHLIQFPRGPTYLVDAGDPGGNLIKLLKERGVETIEKVFISHMHKDHYGGLYSLVDADIKLLELYMRLPSKSDCDAEKPWGCDFEDLLKLVSMLRARNIPIRTLTSNEVLYSSGRVEFKAVYAPDPKGGDVFMSSDINDQCQILRLRHGKMTALFSGDMNKRLALYLMDTAPRELAANILKAPHHGTESTAPDAFFSTVGAEVVLIPSPKELWESERSKRVRDFLAKTHTRVYVNGVHGSVTVNLLSHSYRVETENQ